MVKIVVNGLEIETERKVPHEDIHGWISVAESLPPDYHEVLYCATFERGNKEIMTGHREKGEWTHCCMFYSTMRLNPEFVEVTHWMELPDYPKIEKSHSPMAEGVE